MLPMGAARLVRIDYCCSMSSSARDLVGRGLEAAGSLIGGLIGVHSGDPTMAVLPAVVGATLGGVTSDVLSRHLSERERQRLDVLSSEIRERIQDRIDDGESVRSDGFFQAKLRGRSSAEELLEGVLLTARDTYEEKKLKHIANIFVDAAFTDRLDAGTVYWALKQGEDLTWDQFVLLAIVGSSDFILPEGDIGEHSGTWESFSLHAQLANLGWGQRELIRAENKTTSRGYPIPNSTASHQELTTKGKLLFDVLDLGAVTVTDCEDLLSRLTRMPPEGPDS